MIYETNHDTIVREVYLIEYQTERQGTHSVNKGETSPPLTPMFYNVPMRGSFITSKTWDLMILENKGTGGFIRMVRDGE